LIVIGVVSRFIDHAPNFTPILSIAIMSSLYIKNRFIVLVPLSIMLLSDLYIGNHIIAPWVYSSILVICVISFFAKNNIKNVLSYSLIGSIIFFIVTNFGVWISGGYSYSLEGLLSCYIAAIPFFRNTLISTFLFSLSIFAVYNFVETLVRNTDVSADLKDKIINK
tara:strand:- start:15477 stop:15974 length:498 start_codon:yes stop_codon:yes gene_type:complete